MPRYNGTGPAGTGPLTGWGRGYCGSGAGRPGRTVACGRGARGFGAGRAGGAGIGWNQASAAAEEQLELLRRRAEWLEEELSATRKVITEMESDAE